MSNNGFSALLLEQESVRKKAELESVILEAFNKICEEHNVKTLEDITESIHMELYKGFHKNLFNTEFIISENNDEELLEFEAPRYQKGDRVIYKKKELEIKSTRGTKTPKSGFTYIYTFHNSNLKVREDDLEPAKDSKGMELIEKYSSFKTKVFAPLNTIEEVQQVYESVYKVLPNDEAKAALSLIKDVRIKEISEAKKERSPLQLKYMEYFLDLLDKYSVESPAQLDEEGKKKFFNDVKDGWIIGKGPKETSEE